MGFRSASGPNQEWPKSWAYLAGPRLRDSARPLGDWNNREDGWVPYAGVFGA